MSLNSITSVHLLPVAVISIGKDAQKVALGLDSLYPAALPTTDLAEPSETASMAAAAVASLEATRGGDGSGSGLPAILILASTADGEQVANLVKAIREQTMTLRPRVWPTFVSGDSADLATFDARLDDLGPGACDLVLMMNGPATQTAKTTALGAWLHVKMPAPPSVLGELPDIDGKICRYVAIGSQTVSPATPDPVPSTVVAPTVDSEALTAVVQQELLNRAAQTPEVLALNNAATALCDAAESLDAPALLRTENQFAQLLADVAGRLPVTLGDALPAIIAAQLADAQSRSIAEPAPMAAATDQVAVAATEPTVGQSAAGADDRTGAVSQLVLLTSKGGLSKMFARSRMAGVAQAVAEAARQDATKSVDSVVQQVCSTVPAQVDEVLANRAALLEEERKTAALADSQTADDSWRTALAGCREQVALWPRVDASGVRRSWGGSAPSPRQYIVGSAAALRGLPEDDDALSVVDGGTRFTPRQGEADVTGEIDLRDATRSQQERHATVLLAQYGLPLAAFPS